MELLTHFSHFQFIHQQVIAEDFYLQHFKNWLHLKNSKIDLQKLLNQVCTDHADWLTAMSGNPMNPFLILNVDIIKTSCYQLITTSKNTDFHKILDNLEQTDCNKNRNWSLQS